MVVICTEDLELSMRVQLFSQPQQQAAPRTNREPVLNWKLLRPSKPRMILASVTSAMAMVSLRERTSLKAISEVATISKLFSSDALAALVRSRPSISRMGAAMSSTIMPMV